MNFTIGSKLVREAHSLGAILYLDGDQITLNTPEEFPEELRAALKHHRDEVERVLTRESMLRSSLREWLPTIDTPVVVLDTGRVGKIWGVTGHGLIVNFGNGAPLLTLDPWEVRPLTTDEPHVTSPSEDY